MRTRIASGIVSLLVGGAVALAPAAAAHATYDPTLSGNASACSADGWTSTWTFTNNTHVLTSVDSVLGSAPAGVESSRALPVQLTHGEKITFTSAAPVALREVTLRVNYRSKTIRGAWTEEKHAQSTVKSCCPAPPDDTPSQQPTGGSTTPPGGGGSTPPGGGGETPPPGGGSTTPPSDGGSTPPSDGGTVPPDDDASSPPPAGGGDDEPPVSGGGENPPAGGGIGQAQNVSQALPLTGAPVVGLASLAAALLIGGGIAVVAVHRRRRFEA